MLRRLMAALIIILTVSAAVGCDIRTNNPVQSQPSSSSVSGAEEVHFRGPESIGNMTLQSLIYKSQQAVTVYVVDISDLDDGLKSALRCLQGLVSREEDAAVFLEDGDDDYAWRQYCASEYGVFFKSVTFNELFLRYSDLIQKIIIYDDEGYEFNTAFTMAAVQSGICLDGDAIRQLDSDVLKGKDTEDVRNLWSSYDEAVNYAFENLVSQCTPGYFSSVSTDTCLLDYLYATKTFCIDLSYGGDIGRVSQALLTDTFGLFFGGEAHGTLVSTLSANGFILVPADKLSNSTMLSSLPRLNTQMVQEVPDNSAHGQSRAFISISLLNSTSLESTENYRKILQSQELASAQLGISVNPLLLELAHPILSWYYQNKPAGHEIISSVDGIGMVDWSSFNSEYIDDLRSANSTLLSESGITVLPLSGSSDSCADFSDGLDADCFCISENPIPMIPASGSSTISDSSSDVPSDNNTSSDTSGSLSEGSSPASSGSDSDAAGDALSASDIVFCVSAEDASELEAPLDWLAEASGRDAVFAHILLDGGSTNDLVLNEIADCINDINGEYDNPLTLLTPSGLLDEAEYQID